MSHLENTHIHTIKNKNRNSRIHGDEKAIVMIFSDRSYAGISYNNLSYCFSVNLLYHQALIISYRFSERKKKNNLIWFVFWRVETIVLHFRLIFKIILKQKCDLYDLIMLIRLVFIKIQAFDLAYISKCGAFVLVALF